MGTLLLLPLAAMAQLPKPTYGWNLGNTMEPPGGVGTWGGSPSQVLIDAVSKAGFNTVRIPCAWDSHANHTTHQIDPGYMAQVKQVVDWCYAKKLTVILNCHWDGGWLENHLTGTVNSTINAKMESYWSQIATAFASYDNRLLFAAANEPNVDSAAKMSELLAYYQTFVNTVRSKGGSNRSRWLVVQGPSTDIEKTEALMGALPTDPTPGRLAVEVHYYTPYQYTLMNEDASWGKRFFFWGQGYHSASLPARNPTWGEELRIESDFRKIYEKFIRKGIPVILGEFRASKRTASAELSGANLALHTASTTYWNKYVVDTAHAYGLAPIVWDTPGAGLFDWATGAVVDRRTHQALTGGPATAPEGGDGAPFCFELGTQGWLSEGASITGLSTSTSQKFAGTQSLEVSFRGGGDAVAFVPTPAIPAGKKITFRVWVPAQNKLRAIEPFVVDQKGARISSQFALTTLRPSAWNTFTLTVASTAATPLQKLGVTFVSRAPWSGACYIDSVSW